MPLSAIASLPLKPTAMHAVMTAQETPLRRVLVAPAGLGVVWIDQLVPFHASASENLPDAVLYEPTATQDVVDTQWLACNSASVAPTGEAADWFAQVLPFQYCAYGAPTLLVTLRPTAVHALVLDGAQATS
ncbi:MAG TPA: hypothetical protein VFS37_14165 [Conexibacter sp.]|nr:hypothetical protein [Conexibacter sp.]